MKLRLWMKWTASFLLLFVFLLIIQGYLFYFRHFPFLLSALISLILLIPLAYWLTQSLIHPILEISRKATQILSSMFDRETLVNSGDELENLSQTINEMGTQLRNKIEEISREKNYLQTILKGMTEGVLIVDERGRYPLVVANTPANEANCPVARSVAL